MDQVLIQTEFLTPDFSFLIRLSCLFGLKSRLANRCPFARVRAPSAPRMSGGNASPRPLFPTVRARR